LRIRIAAIGRLKAGPELNLVADYRDRITLAGKQLGLGPLDIIEAEAPRAGDETGALARRRPAISLLLDWRPGRRGARSPPSGP
jgi:23S rRNA (pseudouridine1915-N3)-methyltransferase